MWNVWGVPCIVFPDRYWCESVNVCVMLMWLEWDCKGHDVVFGVGV